DIYARLHWPAAKSSSRGKPPAATPSRKNPGSTIRPASPGRRFSRPAIAPTMATAAANAPRASHTRSHAARRRRQRRTPRPAAGEGHARRQRKRPMTWTLTNFIIELVAGIAGGHAIAAVAKEHSFGALGHTVAGALSGYFLQPLAVLVVDSTGEANL